MPHCYFVGVCKGSAIDSATGNYSIFSLIDELEDQGEARFIPLEIHSYWWFSNPEKTLKFEFEIVIFHTEAEVLTPVSRSDVNFLEAGERNTRVRIDGFPRIAEPGEYQVRVQSRQIDSEHWNLSETFWPFYVVDYSGDEQPRIDGL